MSDQEEKPVLDEQALARLLEAAYVLQEHRRVQEQMDLSLELQSDQLREQELEPLGAPAEPDTESGDTPLPDYTPTLAQIVKIQRQIQVRHLDLQNVMALVAERASSIVKTSSGAAIGIIEGKVVRYRATHGKSALPVGSEVPTEKALCCACLRTGQVIRCADVNPEFLLDGEECERRSIQALISVPVYHNGEIAGALEIYFASILSFTEQDVHTAQLMAGLVTEAFARNAEVTSKKSLASERAAMIEALERLRPKLAALAEAAGTRQDSNGVDAISATGVATENFVCRKCGHKLMAEEQFCGKCGAARVNDGEAPSLQSKLASLWHMQESAKESVTAAPVNGNGAHPDIPLSLDAADMEKLQAAALEAVRPEADLPITFDPELELQIKKMVESLAAEGEIQAAATSTPATEIDLESLHRRDAKPPIEITSEAEADPDAEEPAAEPEKVETDTALTKVDESVAWTSAAKARDFLEQLEATRKRGAFARFWLARRGDIYLAVAVVLVAVVIRWGIWSNHSVAATNNPSVGSSRRKPAPDADLSFFDKFLISVGLAEAPEAPEYKGNPNAQVWVDLHTALYYCQPDDLYGKTPKGKFTTQHDAQLDQYEPAYRKTCD